MTQILPTEITDRLISDHRLPKRLINRDGNDPDAAPRGLYLELSHGREDPAQDMDDWGSTCPDELGPFEWIHFTYMNHGRIGYDNCEGELWLDHNFSKDACFLMPPNSLCRHDDLLFWNGVFYGDWSVIYR